LCGLHMVMCNADSFLKQTVPLSTHKVLITFKDGAIEVSFKALEGVEDQGGGPIWRVQDASNYYIARANPLESNFRLYYVKNSKRKTLDSAKVKVPANRWHTIMITTVTCNHPPSTAMW
jgi:hypothetical protein